MRSRHWRRFYVYRRPFDYRTKRLWIGTAATPVVVGTSRSWGYIIGVCLSVVMRKL